jgi:hypothetical protein
MQIKNWLIGILVTTNILSLFIIVGKKTNTPILYDEQMLKSSKETLIKDYNPSGQSCGAAISLAKRESFSGTARLDMVCLIQGSRTVIWRTLQEVKSELINEYNLFEQLAKQQDIQELNGVSYRPEGKRNALLFIKQALLYERNGFSANDFLQGYLLGYDKKDIEFFYQRWEFHQQLKKKNEENVLIPSSYTEFGPELTKEFENFKKNVWPLSKSNNRYELDQKEAIDWLEQNEAFSNDQLYQQIQELKKTS